MGRYIKNVELHAASYAIRLPMGTSSLAPQEPQDGQIRFNISSDNLEVFRDGQWFGAAIAGRVAIVKNLFTGDGSTTLFSGMSNLYLSGHEAEILVFVGGVYQNPGVAYTVSGTNISFTSPPGLGIPIILLHNFNSTAV
jgi:hypothetical protein